MSDSPSPSVPIQKRLLRPLPTPGAARRVKKQPATPGNRILDASVHKESQNEEEQTTPKASTSALPLAEAAQPLIVPSIKLNDEPIQTAVNDRLGPIIAKAKDAELRRMIFALKLTEEPTTQPPKLHIPRKPIKPPTMMQRKMAKVKTTVVTAPRPQITFGETVTVFGAEVKETPAESQEGGDTTPVQTKVELSKEDKPEVQDTTSEEVTEDNEEGSEKEDEPSEKKEISFGLPANYELSKEAQRRLLRERRERHKPRLPPPPPPDPSQALTEGKRKPISLTEDVPAKSQDDAKQKRKQEMKAQLKKLAIIMARDIHEKQIPKAQLNMLTRGKSPQEAKAMLSIVNKAWKMAERLKEKERKRGEEKGSAERKAGSEEEDNSDAEASEGEARKEKSEKAKGKERAPGWSTRD